ncbi:hypothetical protein NSR01_10115 [Anoxybacillus sp. FSL W8-0703]|uniref:Uncharacterized protein n=1 Tax=Anoxybacillus flavithermus TaxID=33934 RepID=A0A178TJE7_9BACL|nr:hypothetical protein [Anoxybacillus flavithermus]OAO80281.1 hypothetical protein TAF16_1188 [Anoxybacillus flavithermus]
MKDYERMWNELIRELEKIEEGDDPVPVKIAHELLKTMALIEAKHSN